MRRGEKEREEGDEVGLERGEMEVCYSNLFYLRYKTKIRFIFKV